MNRLLFGDNLKPKRSGDAAVPLPPQWLTNQNVFPDACVAEAPPDCARAHRRGGESAW
jgi:hypothetical protein